MLMALMAKKARAPNKIDFFMSFVFVCCYNVISIQKPFQKSWQEQAAVTIAEEAEVVVKGEAVTILPTLADEGGDQE